MLKCWREMRAVTASGLWGSSVAAVVAAVQKELHRHVLLKFAGTSMRRPAVRDALRAGAERVILGTAAYNDIDFLDDVLGAYRERVIVSVDTRGGKVSTSRLAETTQMPADPVIERLQQRGVRSFVYTTSTATGCSSGPTSRRSALARSCAGASSTPAASARSPTCEALAALRQVNLGGVIVGKALYEGRFTVAEAPARARAPRRRPRYGRAVHLKRVIPCLDVDGGRVVKGTNFVDLRDAGDPVELAERYDAAGADELVFLDITATHERRETIVELARRTADNVFVPFTIGGGIRSVADAQAVLDAAPTR